MAMAVLKVALGRRDLVRRVIAAEEAIFFAFSLGADKKAQALVAFVLLSCGDVTGWDATLGFYFGN